MSDPPPPETLQLLLQRAQQQRDQAQSTLRRADETAARASAQCVQLQQYRGDYEQRWTTQFHRGGTIEIVQCYRSFMQRLDQALLLQTRQAELAAAQRERARQALMESERQVAAVRKLLQRRAAEHSRVLRAREQKHSDETAQRLHWRGAALDGPKLQ